MHRLAALVVLIVATACSGQPTVEELLHNRPLSQAVTQLEARHRESPVDQQVRLALGAALFLEAGEQFAADLYRHGLRANHPMLSMGVGGFIPPVPTNPEPELLNFAGLDAIMKRARDRLLASAAMLEGVTSPESKVRLQPDAIRLDLDGPDRREGNATLYLYFATYSQTLRQADSEDLVITLDASDAIWMRAYAHILSGLCELWLAYDESRLFSHCGHVFFDGAIVEHDFLRGETGEIGSISDLIAAVHLVDFPVRDPAASQRALTHFQQAVALSRQLVASIQAETDDDAEWVPNPRQHAALPNAVITQDQFDAWVAMLGELEEILAGRKLVVF